jgi:hypothetical protein
MIDVDGQEKQVNIESRALEDVIGPMVNHQVRAEVARRENNKFWLIDGNGTIFLTPAARLT